VTCGGIRLVERNANVVCDEMESENKSQKSNGTQDTKYIVEKKQCKNTNIFWGRLPLQFPVGNCREASPKKTGPLGTPLFGRVAGVHRRL